VTSALLQSTILYVGAERSDNRGALIFEPLGALSGPHALRHKAILSRTVERFTFCAHGFTQAGVSLALLHEAHFGSTVKRLSIRTYRLAIARLRCDGANHKAGHQSSKNNRPHGFFPPMLHSPRVDPVIPGLNGAALLSTPFQLSLAPERS
jgi:hypothetical protein